MNKRFYYSIIALQFPMKDKYWLRSAWKSYYDREYQICEVPGHDDINTGWNGTLYVQTSNGHSFVYWHCKAASIYSCFYIKFLIYRIWSSKKETEISET